MTHSSFWLRKLRIIQCGQAVYEGEFHLGVNIIHGENGSGKSTVADSIFYILGGEFDNWKTAATSVEQVQAEIVTKGGTVTLRRDKGKAQTPISIFYGPMEEAHKHGLDGWEIYPIRRTGSGLSFTQILFRAAGIPEAQSLGASNITMHQILRLLYSDQRTPAGFLFRYENFDRREIREAVGDLVCGLNVYELYEIDLKLRDLGNLFDEKKRALSALLMALPKEETIAQVSSIDSRLHDLSNESDRLKIEIENVDEYVAQDQLKEFIDARTNASNDLRKQLTSISGEERRLQVNSLEISDLQGFLEYLEEMAGKLPQAQAASDIIGNIDFTHCPACLAPLAKDKGAGHCFVCGSETDLEKERSRYLQIKTDLDIQIRESHQLLEEKEQMRQQIERDLRVRRREYQERLSVYSVKYDVSTSPRESFIAQRYQRLGQIDREIIELGRLRDRVTEIEKLSNEKAELQGIISRLEDRKRALESSGRTRRHHALTLVSNVAREILHMDLNRQPEFQSAEAVSINFADNSIQVDGNLNFAESSNVIVKNSAILSLLVAATKDPNFFHPRFGLFDNIEDKGMEQERSHNFQKIICQLSDEAKMEHQIIFTTSMLNPNLDHDKLVIGPRYTHEYRTLRLNSAS